MAHFKSIVTDLGTEKLSQFVAKGKQLSLVRAEVGSGRTDKDRAALTELVHPEVADVWVGEMETATSGGATVMRLPVQVSNKGLTAPLPVREVAIYGIDDGNEFLFATSWLDGADTDNIVPVSGIPGDADTMHIHDVGVILTNQEAAVIKVEIGVGSMVTESRLTEYAAPKVHTHTSDEVLMANGKNLEQAMADAGGGLVIIPPGEDIPVEQRKEGFLYFRVSEEV